MAKPWSTTEVWANAVASGVPDDVFWRSTPDEVALLMDALLRAEDIRIGRIVAPILNRFRPRGAPRVKTADFIHEPVQKMTVDQAKTEWDWLGN